MIVISFPMVHQLDHNFRLPIHIDVLALQKLRQDGDGPVHGGDVQRGLAVLVRQVGVHARMGEHPPHDLDVPGDARHFQRRDQILVVPSVDHKCE